MGAVQNYRSKLSGPIMDRIDLYCDVHDVDYANILVTPTIDQATKATLTAKSRISAARERQYRRFQSPKLNAAMTNRDIARHGRLSDQAKQLLDSSANSLQLSARAYIRTIKVARTIADLNSSKDIGLLHLTEALQYRSRAN